MSVKSRVRALLVLSISMLTKTYILSEKCLSVWKKHGMKPMKSQLAAKELFSMLTVIVNVCLDFSLQFWLGKKFLLPSHRSELYVHLYSQRCLVTPIATVNKIRDLLFKKKKFNKQLATSAMVVFCKIIIFLSLVFIAYIRNFLSKQNNKKWYKIRKLEII